VSITLQSNLPLRKKDRPRGGAHKTVSVPTDYLSGLFLYIFQQCDKMGETMRQLEFDKGEQQ
jgi:hypothetical protein